MNALTKNLINFSVGLVVLTIIFRYSLSSMLQLRLLNEVWMLASVYGVLVFILGWIFGKKDKMHLPLYDIGFRFHLETYFICNIIAKVWYYLGLQSENENVRTINLTIIVWGIGLIIHFIFYLFTRKNVIKGIKKSEIFE